MQELFIDEARLKARSELEPLRPCILKIVSGKPPVAEYISNYSTPNVRFHSFAGSIGDWNGSNNLLKLKKEAFGRLKESIAQGGDEFSNLNGISSEEFFKVLTVLEENSILWFSAEIDLLHKDFIILKENIVCRPSFEVRLKLSLVEFFRVTHLRDNSVETNYDIHGSEYRLI